MPHSIDTHCNTMILLVSWGELELRACFSAGVCQPNVSQALQKGSSARSLTMISNWIGGGYSTAQYEISGEKMVDVQVSGGRPYSVVCHCTL
jgi:hypothetical protein